MRALTTWTAMGRKGSMDLPSVTLFAFVLLVVLIAATVVGGTLNAALNHAAFLMH
jgi:hypothetical protein